MAPELGNKCLRLAFGFGELHVQLQLYISQGHLRSHPIEM
jgi:hypothetical protein